MNKIKEFVKRKFISITLVLIVLSVMMGIILPATGVLATVAPISPNFISIVNSTASNQPQVFENVYVKGDLLFVFGYDIDYTGLTTPSVPCNTLYYGQILDTNNSTVITTTHNPLLYYGYGLSAFYFNPTDVTQYGLTWNTSYYIQIKGTTDFTIIPTNEYQLVPGNWKTSTTLSGAALELKQYLINFEIPYLQNGNGTQYLTQNAAGNEVLNVAGGQLVNSVIPYIDSQIPDMYQTTNGQINPLAITPATTNVGANLTLSNQLGPTLDNDFVQLGALIGITDQQVAMGWIVICVCLIIGIIMSATGNLVGAGICAIPMVFVGVWIGAIPVAFVFTSIMVGTVLLVFYLFIRGM